MTKSKEKRGWKLYYSMPLLRLFPKHFKLQCNESFTFDHSVILRGQLLPKSSVPQWNIVYLFSHRVFAGLRATLLCTPDTCCPAVPAWCAEVAAAGAVAAGCGAEASCPGSFLHHTLASETEIQGPLTNQSQLWNAEVLKVFFISCLFGYLALKLSLQD